MIVKRKIFPTAIAALALGVVFAAGWEYGRTGNPVGPISDAEAAGGVVTGPNVEAPDRYVYYPGTETLAEDEVRVIACGTGMPEQRRSSIQVAELQFHDGWLTCDRDAPTHIDLQPPVGP